MENNNFYTYGMIKPDAIDRMQEIIKMIYESGLEVHYMKLDNLTSDIIDENYAHCKDRSFYPKMKENLLSGPVLKMLIYDSSGNAVINYRNVLGAANSADAKENTIRGRFGNKEVTYKNAVHGSGNEKEAGEEIIRFFKNDLDMMLNELRIYTFNKATQITLYSIGETSSISNYEDVVDSYIKKIKKDYNEKGV